MSAPLAPTASPDTQFFWDGLARGVLLIQRCTSCGALRHPPRPMCPRCNELGWDAVEASGRGTVHSAVVPRHPPFPFLDDPCIVALVDLEEGTRLVTNLVDVDPERVELGMAVEVTFRTFDNGVVLHQFRPAVAP